MDQAVAALRRFAVVLVVLAGSVACGDSAPSGVDAGADAAQDVGEDPAADADANVGDAGQTDADARDADPAEDAADGGQDSSDAGAGGGDGGGDVAAGDAGNTDTADGSTADTGTDAGTDAVQEDVSDASLPDAASPCGGVDDRFVGDIAPADGWVPLDEPACTRSIVTLVVPSGAVWDVEARAVGDAARLFAFGPGARATFAAGGTPTAIAQTAFSDEDDALSVAVAATRSGEHAVWLHRDDAREPRAVEVRAVCREGCDRETTRYPVVLVHGYAGVDSYFGILDYFYDVRGPLGDRGYDVHAPVTDPIATSTRRAEQLAGQIDDVLASSRAGRVNIIAHSQGGLDARVLVSGMGYGDRVASITTIATPHRGVPAVLWDFFSVQSFDPDEMAAFNATYVDDPQVRYWSWSARSCAVLAFGCKRDSAGESIDAFLVATFTLLRRFGDNDGIVTTDSMPWGEHLGLLYADHFDQIGQIADRSPADDPFDHRAFYLSEVRRLAAAGF